MKKILVASMVLGIAAMVANAAITTTLVKTGTYTCVTTGGGTFTVEQYTLGATAPGTDPNNKITAAATYTRGKAVQVWKWEYGDDETFETEDDIYTPTPTMNNQTTAANARNADTHMLFSDNLLLNVVAPAETNDQTLGTTGGIPRRIWGLGQDTLDDTKSSPNVLDNSFMAVCGFDTTVQSHVVNWFQVGYKVGGDPIHLFGSVTDGFIEQTFDYWIPEPATLTLLGLGGLALIRRRR